MLAREIDAKRCLSIYNPLALYQVGGVSRNCETQRLPHHRKEIRDTQGISMGDARVQFLSFALMYFYPLFYQHAEERAKGQG